MQTIVTQTQTHDMKLELDVFRFTQVVFGHKMKSFKDKRCKNQTIKKTLLIPATKYNGVRLEPMLKRR